MLYVVYSDTRVLRTKFSFLINACFLNVFFIYFFYRYSTEELTLASFGDSETESEDEDVDFENLDSVSIVAARASSSSSSTSSTSSHNGGPLIRGVRPHGASPSLDSGRGDSPESSCNSTLVLTPNASQSKLIHIYYKILQIFEN